MMNERLVIDTEPVDWGFDLTLIEARLALSPEDRVRREVEHSRRMKEIRESRSVPQPEFDPRPIFDALLRHGVDFVVVGGLAGIAHGSAYNTEDVDIAHERSQENLERLAAALTELGATLRGAPRGSPLEPDAETLRAGLNLTFDTRFGSLDILGQPAGATRHDELRGAGSTEELWGVRIRISSLDHLIAMKEAAARPRDLTMAAEYRTLADLRRAAEPG